jgi:hypothetical protein
VVSSGVVEVGGGAVFEHCHTSRRVEALVGQRAFKAVCVVSARPVESQLVHL